MTKQEMSDLIRYIDDNYNGNFIKNNNTTFVKTWESELSQYEYEDVLENFKQYARNDNYNKPPALFTLLSGLQKTSNKVDFTKKTYFCNLCNKAFNGYEEQKEHYNKCLSINYVIRETKKWFDKNLSRRELWDMPEEEFEERYNKLVKYIMEHTTNELERKRISFIFNPPTEEEAKKFLNYN